MQRLVAQAFFEQFCTVLHRNRKAQGFPAEFSPLSLAGPATLLSNIAVFYLAHFFYGCLGGFFIENAGRKLGGRDAPTQLVSGGVRLGQERGDHSPRAFRHGGCEMSDARDDHVGGVGKRSGRDFPPTRRCDGVEAVRQDQGWNGTARSGALRRGSRLFSAGQARQMADQLCGH